MYSSRVRDAAPFRLASYSMSWLMNALLGCAAGRAAETISSACRRVRPLATR